MDIKNTKPDLLILTSSLKEVMLLWEHGIKSVAIHGENSTFDKDFIRHIKKYCKNIKSLYDWDEAGEAAAEKLFDLYDIDYFTRPYYLNCKDISDCYKENKEDAIKFLKTIK